MDFLDNFGGEALLANSNASALRTMKSGLAQIVGASLNEKVNKKDGVISYSVKIDFDALAKNGGGITGYIRSNRAQDLFKTMNKYKYLFIHEQNETANAIMKTLGNPFKKLTHTVTKTEMVDGVEVETKEEQPLKIKDLKAELEPLRLLHGEQLDFIYLNDDKDYSAQAVEVLDAKGYCEKLVNAVNELIKAESIYSLKIVEGNRGFDEIHTIIKANI